VSDLIDTTEMYLRTIYELQEEGIVPLRARIAERLSQSGPTVSQTVARMERDGLVVVEEDRHLALTPAGLADATRVMRKHRLAERLLHDVIGLDWELVHDEACRWEHVISDAAERRLLILLDNPVESPFGNPIPGLAELDPDAPQPGPLQGVPMSRAVGSAPGGHTIVRISERLQEQPDVMAILHKVGVRPGARVTAARARPGVLEVTGDGASIDLAVEHADHIAVLAEPTQTPSTPTARN